METAYRKTEKLATRLQKNNIQRLLQPGCNNDCLPLQQITIIIRIVCHTNIIMNIIMSMVTNTMVTTTIIT